MKSAFRQYSLRQYAVALVCITTTSALLLPTAAQAKSGPAQKSSPASSTFVPGAQVLTIQEVALLAPADQEKLLDPLRAIASSVDQAGKSRDADVYSTVRIDAGHDVVDVYVTKPAKAAQLVTDAQRITPSINTRLIEVKSAPFTLVQLHAARDQFLAQSAARQLPYAVNSVAVATDGSSLQIGVDNPVAARAADVKARSLASAAAASSTPVVARIFVKAARPRLTSWADIKWHDSAPFIGGDVLTDGNNYCTAGLPAIRTSTGAAVMITADHCWDGGTNVYTATGATGVYTFNGSASTGNYVGTVTGRVHLWDAEELEGADNNADESDNASWIPLTSDSYSYNGDLVCHDGSRSFFLGHGTPCGIQVVNQDITWNECYDGACYTTRGVEGTQVNGGWGAAEGDSGATVFTICGNNCRVARGIVTAGASSTDCDPTMFWTEAPDIFKYFGLELNPKT